MTSWYWIDVSVGIGVSVSSRLRPYRPTCRPYLTNIMKGFFFKLKTVHQHTTCRPTDIIRIRTIASGPDFFCDEEMWYQWHSEGKCCSGQDLIRAPQSIWPMQPVSRYSPPLSTEWWYGQAATTGGRSTGNLIFFFRPPPNIVCWTEH